MMDIVGGIIFTVVATIPFGYREANGACLQFKEYPELGEALHHGDSWPYGLCNGGFRLPDMRSKNWKIGDPVPLIKVK